MFFDQVEVAVKKTNKDNKVSKQAADTRKVNEVTHEKTVSQSFRTSSYNKHSSVQESDADVINKQVPC